MYETRLPQQLVTFIVLQLRLISLKAGGAPGAKSINFRGIRNLVFPLGSPPDWRRALLMESIYAVIHAGSVVLAYRVVVDLQLRHLNASVIFPTLISALVWLSGVSIFIFLKYPESLVDKKSLLSKLTG